MQYLKKEILALAKRLVTKTNILLPSFTPLAYVCLIIYELLIRYLVKSFVFYSSKCCASKKFRNSTITKIKGISVISTSCRNLKIIWCKNRKFFVCKHKNLCDKKKSQILINSRGLIRLLPFMSRFSLHQDHENKLLGWLIVLN